jgi:hypothetical protein
MVPLETCKMYLEKKDLTDKRIAEIRDYLYAISREIIRNSLSEHKKSYGETQTTTTKQ